TSIRSLPSLSSCHGRLVPAISLRKGRICETCLAQPCPFGSNSEKLGPSKTSPCCPSSGHSCRLCEKSASGHKRSSRLLVNGGHVTARQGNDELGELAGLGVNVDPAAMLLDDDVIGHREAEPRAFPGWLGGQKGIEHLLSHFGRDTAAVV